MPRIGDYDAIMRFFAPDVVWQSLDGLGKFEDASAVRGFLEDFGSAYESFRTEPKETIDTGGGIVFGVIRQADRLRGGAGRVVQRFAWVMASAEGRVVRFLAGMDIDDARAVAERLVQEPE